MNLKVLLPFKIYADVHDIRRLVVETRCGSYGVLPRRLDCVMALVPGILVYEDANGEETYMAVDEGVMIKTGSEVRVSVRNAITGQELGKLREAVEKEFLSVGEQEAAVKVVLARMESDLFQRMARLRHGR